MKRFHKFLAALLVLTFLVSTVAVTGALAYSKIKITGKCNLRSGPGLGYSIKRTVPYGAKVTYLNSSKKDGRGVRWYKIKYSGSTGWVSSKYAKLSSSSSSSSSSYGHVRTTGSVHIRTSPKLSGKILGSVPAGTKLTYRGKSSKDGRGVRWYAVWFNGHKGWVSSVYSYRY